MLPTATAFVPFRDFLGKRLPGRGKLAAERRGKAEKTMPALNLFHLDGFPRQPFNLPRIFTETAGLYAIAQSFS